MSTAVLEALAVLALTTVNVFIECTGTYVCTMDFNVDIEEMIYSLSSAGFSSEEGGINTLNIYIDMDQLASMVVSAFGW